MNVNIGAQTNQKLPYVQAVEEIAEIVVKYELKPFLWFKAGFYLSGYGQRFDYCLSVLKELSSRVRTCVCDTHQYLCR